MTYPQHHHSEHSAPEKVRQETTTTTISTTTTTASSTIPLVSDSEPTMYNTQKAMHYGRSSNGAKHSNLLELESGRPTNGGRSSSLSSSSSANDQTLNHKSSHNGLNGGGGAGSGNGGSNKTGAGIGAAFASHHSNGSSASLPPGRAAVPSSERVRSGAHDPSDYSNGAHSWPILFAVIPPLGALVFGKSDIFSDILTLALIAFFLYNIIKGKRDQKRRFGGDADARPSQRKRSIS
jgi:hypothetical protein